MGRRGTKVKNSSQKKKKQSPPLHPNKPNDLPFPSLPQPDLKNSKNEALERCLKIELKDLFTTFTVRLSSNSTPYKTDLNECPGAIPPNMVQIISILITDLAEDILSQAKPTHSLPFFLQEAFNCITSAGQLLTAFCKNDSALNTSRLIYFSKILKPAWDTNKELSKNSSVRALFKELSTFTKNFKDLSLLPLENLVQMINGNNASKIFSRFHCESSTDESSSPIRSIDSEIEEFQLRLEKCKINNLREKPLVSQEWISHLKRRLSQNLKLSN